jgi:hypothetical protein
VRGAVRTDEELGITCRRGDGERRACRGEKERRGDETGGEEGMQGRRGEERRGEGEMEVERMRMRENTEERRRRLQVEWMGRVNEHYVIHFIGVTKTLS